MVAFELCTKKICRMPLISNQNPQPSCQYNITEITLPFSRTCHAYPHDEPVSVQIDTSYFLHYNVGRKLIHSQQQGTISCLTSYQSCILIPVFESSSRLTMTSEPAERQNRIEPPHNSKIHRFPFLFLSLEFRNLFIEVELSL